MRRIVIHAVALACAAFIGKQAAHAGSYAAAEINMWAGPSTRYPFIGSLPEGTSLHVFGCTKRFRWCDVEGGGRRGWVSAAYIDVAYDTRRVRVPMYVRDVDAPMAPTISFNISTYWSSHYSSCDFYEDVDTWDDLDWETDAPPLGWEPDWDE